MLFSTTIQSLEKSLNFSTAKNRAISNNIANADTPGFKAQRVTFEEHLTNASIQAKKTDERHLSFKGAQKSSIPTPREQSYHHNGNSVDVDYEMAEMAKNQIYYNTSIDMLSKKFNSLKQSIGGGQ